MEVGSGAWFGSILFPGAVDLIVGGPIALAGGAANGEYLIMNSKCVEEDT